MLNYCDYTREGKFVSLRQSWSKDGNTEVPVALLDELLERRLSKYDLEKLLTFRHLTKGRNYRRAEISELVGADLTGKTVAVYFSNWEDSELLSTANAVTVVKDGGGELTEYPTYSFAFPEEWDKCDEGECNHEKNGEECHYDQLQSYNFHAGETVFVMDKEQEATK